MSTKIEVVSKDQNAHGKTILKVVVKDGTNVLERRYQEHPEGWACFYSSGKRVH